MRLSVPILAGLVLLAQCAPPPPFPMPPPLPPEILPLPPVSEAPLIWRPGDWAYAGTSYRYEPGQYVPAAGHIQLWVLSHWAPGPDGPVWAPGQWQ